MWLLAGTVSFAIATTGMEIARFARLTGLVKVLLKQLHLYVKR